MFVGSFYRLQNRNDIERKIPLGSNTSIIYIEDEGKFYERNIYGLISEYSVGHKEPVSVCKCIDHTDEIADMEGRIHDLEIMIKQVNNFLGGKVNEI